VGAAGWIWIRVRASLGVSASTMPRRAERTGALVLVGAARWEDRAAGRVRASVGLDRLAGSGFLVWASRIGLFGPGRAARPAVREAVALRPTTSHKRSVV